MATVEQYQTDIFAIIVVVASVAIVVFLIVAAIYFNGLRNWSSVPGQGETTFLFWASIVLGIIFLVIVVIGLYRIFTHRAVICPGVKRRRHASPPVVEPIYSPPPVYDAFSSPMIPVANAQKPVTVTRELPDSDTSSAPMIPVSRPSAPQQQPSAPPLPSVTSGASVRTDDTPIPVANPAGIKAPAKTPPPLPSRTIPPAQTGNLAGYPSANAAPVTAGYPSANAAPSASAAPTNTSGLPTGGSTTSELNQQLLALQALMS